MKKLLLSSVIVATVFACNSPSSSTESSADSTQLETTPPAGRPGTMESDTSTMLPSDTSSTTDTMAPMNRQ